MASLKTCEVAQILPVALKCEATSLTSSSNGIAESTQPRNKSSLQCTETYSKRVAFRYMLPLLTASQNLCAYMPRKACFLLEAFLQHFAGTGQNSHSAAHGTHCLTSRLRSHST